jgi:hypothetical protein
MNHLDGNVLAGPAAGLLDFEVTTAQGRCLSCGEVADLGQARVYGAPMGYVARCSTCDNVLLVLVEHVGLRTLSTSGLRWMRDDTA